MKYIIDTDPGIDDTIAITLAYLNKLDIIGFTIASGNIPLKKTMKNIKIIQDVLGSNIKMYKGEIENKCNHETAEYAHGKDGLGYTYYPDTSKRKFERKKAEDFIISASKKYKDNLTLICFGPLTNIANAIKKDKDLPKRIKHIIIMGTSYNPRTKKPYMEFNVNVDPISAKTVFNAPFNDMRLVTHEIGIKSVIEKDYIRSLRNSDNHISRFIASVAEKYMDFSYERYKITGLASPDPATIASIINPDVITFKPCTIKVNIDENKKATCEVKLINDSNIKVAVKCDVDKYRELFKSCIN